MSAEKKACHAGKHALKEGIQEGHYGNRRPHTCRGGNRRNNIPDGSPSPVTIRLGIMTFTITGRAAIFLAIANPFFPLSHEQDWCYSLQLESGLDWSDSNRLLAFG